MENPFRKNFTFLKAETHILDETLSPLKTLKLNGMQFLIKTHFTRSSNPTHPIPP